MTSGLAVAAAASLLVLPGAWITFAAPVPHLSLRSRLALAGILSPVVLVAQYYALRLAGLPLATAAWALVAINAGSVVFIWRRWTRDRQRPLAIGISPLLDAGVFLLLVGCIAIPWFAVHELRIFNFHAWLHASIANQFLGGRLLPEEPELGGLALAYPWLGHVYWSLLSYVSDWPHTRVYVATDVACLAWTSLAVFETTRALGARAATGRLALVWLTLGCNIIGFWVLTATGRMLGDIRHTPWLRKFMISELTAFVLALLAGLMLVGVVALRTRSRALLALVCVLTASLGLLYALMLPAALAVCGVLFLWWWFDPELGDARSRRLSAAAFAGGVAMAAAAAAAFLGTVTSSRSAAPVALSGVEALVSKLATGLVAVAPFLLAIALDLRRRWRDPAVGMLLGAAALCFLLRPAVQLAGYAEYKFMFPTVLFLAPIAALAVERWTPTARSMDWLVLASALVLLPSVTARDAGWGQRLREQYPPVYEEGTSLVLDTTAAEAGWVAAIRTGTPADTLVAVRRARFLLPVLTDRALLAPPEEIAGEAHPGYYEHSRFNLVNLRGYPVDIVDARAALLQQVFGAGGAPANAADLLDRLRALNRPMVLVFERGDDRTFLTWLQHEHHGREIFASPDGHVVVWLIDRGPA